MQMSRVIGVDAFTKYQAIFGFGILRVKTLTDAVYVPVRTNMLYLYMAGYTYPAQGYPGILPRVRGSEASQSFMFDL